MTITPKNWSEFQHYKNRSPAWIKLHRGLLDNYEFHRLPLASKALAPLLWLLASEYDKGKITADIDALAFRFRMTSPDLIGAIKPLIEGGFFTSDSDMLAPCKQTACLEERRGEREEEKEKKDKTADAVSILKAYVFEGDIVKLNKKHFDNWSANFANLDLRAELTARDVWLASERATDEDRKNWFISTSKYLANENAKGKNKPSRQETAEDAIYRGVL